MRIVSGLVALCMLVVLSLTFHFVIGYPAEESGNPRVTRLAIHSPVGENFSNMMIDSMEDKANELVDQPDLSQIGDELDSQRMENKVGDLLRGVNLQVSEPVITTPSPEPEEKVPVPAVTPLIETVEADNTSTIATPAAESVFAVQTEASSTTKPVKTTTTTTTTPTPTAQLPDTMGVEESEENIPATSEPEGTKSVDTDDTDKLLVPVEKINGTESESAEAKDNSALGKKSNLVIVSLTLLCGLALSSSQL